MPTETLDASPVPSESIEQTRLFQWVRMQQGRWPELRLLYHIPNGGSRHRLEAIHLKQQGVRAGVPDLCLPVARAGCHGLYVEMKRLKGGRVSPEQLAWMEALQAEGYMVAVCQGWEMASDVILRYLKGRDGHGQTSA
ncbi:MAG: VRR-NUC domain-containing protein [Candidatus Limiplasma sp.]|nr:VRR-NUC domain-containing protein [Candidatus Limiplasma sp.]